MLIRNCRKNFALFVSVCGFGVVPGVCMDTINDTNILTHIESFLPTSDHSNFATTCKKFAEANRNLHTQSREGWPDVTLTHAVLMHNVNLLESDDADIEAMLYRIKNDLRLSIPMSAARIFSVVAFAVEYTNPRTAIKIINCVDDSLSDFYAWGNITMHDQEREEEIFWQRETSRFMPHDWWPVIGSFLLYSSVMSLAQISGNWLFENYTYDLMIHIPVIKYLAQSSKYLLDKGFLDSIFLKLFQFKIHNLYKTATAANSSNLKLPNQVRRIIQKIKSCTNKKAGFVACLHAIASNKYQVLQCLLNDADLMTALSEFFDTAGDLFVQEVMFHHKIDTDLLELLIDHVFSDAFVREILAKLLKLSYETGQHNLIKVIKNSPRIKGRYNTNPEIDFCSVM